METEHTDPAAAPPTRPPGRRVAVWAAVALGVWASLWLLARSTTPAETHRPSARTPASGVGLPPSEGGASMSPTFAHSAGWSIRTAGVVSPGSPGSRGLPMAVAVNVPLARQDVTFIAAHGLSEAAVTATMSSLPPNGVMIVALLPFPTGIGPAPPHFGDFPDRRLPLELSDARVNRQWQSQPRPNAPEYDVWGRVEGTYVEVSVYFGTPRPSARTYAAAQSELGRLILPGVPSGYVPTLAWTADNAGPLTIQTPPGWTFAANPDPGVNPRIWFAVGTWPFPRGGLCGPVAALRFLPRNGALLWVSETFDPGFASGTFPRKPAHFSLRGLTPRRFECSGSRPTYVLRFRSHGRFFQVQIAFGPGASKATRAEALRSLSSLRVGSGAG